MINDDTIYLLRECNSGTKMAVYSIDEVLEKINDSTLKELLCSSKGVHEQIGNEIHQLLESYGDETKEPNAMAKGMSWMKTNVKLAMDDSDKVCADLITDGCNMGIKSLFRYKNQYPAAEEKAQSLCMQLIREEENLCVSLRSYL